jgi:hypothetical protein
VGVALLVAGLLGSVLLLLAVPVNVDFRVEGVEPFGGHVGVRWLFGLVRIRIPFPGARAPRRRREADPAAARARGGSTAFDRGRDVLASLRQAGFRRRVYRLGGDLFRAIHVQRVRLLMRLGLGDPADTGLLWTVVGPVNAMARSRDADIRIEPDFLEPVLEFQADGSFLVVPLRLVFLVVGFALSPPTLRAWHTLRRNRA